MAKPTKPETKLKLTRRNAAALAKYAGSVGLEPEKFLNRFLEDFLTNPWDDRNDNGNAEYYLGSFAFKDQRQPNDSPTGCNTGLKSSGMGRK
jgi:hypothetical protein